MSDQNVKHEHDSSKPAEYAAGDQNSLLSGERRVWSLEVVYSPHASKPMNEFEEPVTGTLLLTNYRLQFSTSSSARFKLEEIPDFFGFPLGILSRFECVADTLVFYLKDCRVLAFDIHTKEMQVKAEAFDLLLQRYAFCDYPTSSDGLENQCYLSSPTSFAYIHGKASKVATLTSSVDNASTSSETEDTSEPSSSAPQTESKFVFDMSKEFIRLGFFQNPRSNWRKTMCNSSYELCPTYPSILCVPGRQTDEDLKEAAQHRSKQRLPVACFLHPNSSAALIRCSQPFVGLRGKRSEADERLLQHAEVKHILDCRPKKSAMANLAAGKGYENHHFYPELKQGIQFCDIENIHSVRKAYQGISNLFFKAQSSSGRVGSTGSQEENSWLSALEVSSFL